MAVYKPLGPVAIGFIGCKMNKAAPILAHFRQILPGFIHFSLRQTQWLQALFFIVALFYWPLLWANPIQRLNYDIPFAHGQIHVEEKKLAQTHPQEVIILLAPLSIPSLLAFDVERYSLMDVLANAGFDVWAIDFSGEGHSSYPEVMQISPAPKGIFPLRATEAAQQLDVIIQFIRKNTGIHSVSLLGWSWGSVVAALYSSQHPQTIHTLILYGSMYSASLPGPIQNMMLAPFQTSPGTFNNQLPAYQNIPWQEIRKHWVSMMQDHTDIASPDAIRAVEQAYLQSDPHPFIPGTLRRPMGPMQDLFSIWHQRPIYPIASIQTPTLVIYGDLDLFADHHLYDQLSGVLIKKKIVIPQATHWLIYEKNRAIFYTDVISFLKENDTTHAGNYSPLPLPKGRGGH